MVEVEVEVARERVRETETDRVEKKDKVDRQCDQSMKYTVNYHGLVPPSLCPSSLSSCHVSRGRRESDICSALALII